MDTIAGIGIIDTVAGIGGLVGILGVARTCMLPITRGGVIGMGVTTTIMVVVMEEEVMVIITIMAVEVITTIIAHLLGVTITTFTTIQPTITIMERGL